jgi:adenylate cyclase
MTDPWAQFVGLVRQFGEATDPEARRQVEQQLWERFGQRCAVFVSDLSGFSLLTERHSIVHFLALIHECRELLAPVVAQGGGSWVKTAADNIYAIFPDPTQAIGTSIAMQQLLDRRNADRPPDEQIGLCVGIGYGEILVIPERDFFGHQLNLAFKLGEDVAERGEILVTRAAMEAAGTAFSYEPRTVSISGVTIPHAAVGYR